MQQVSALMGLHKSKSSRLHPLGDGISEEMVKLVKSIIQKDVDTHGNNRDNDLQSAAFAIRSTINNSVTQVVFLLINTTQPFDIRQAQGFPRSVNEQMENSNRITNDVHMSGSYRRSCEW